jgi:hypothetical protein
MNAPLRILHLEDSLIDVSFVDYQLRLEWPDCHITVVASREAWWRRAKLSAPL